MYLFTIINNNKNMTFLEVNCSFENELGCNFPNKFVLGVMYQ